MSRYYNDGINFSDMGNSIAHSAKGSTWKNHKYIRKEGNRYVYSESDKKQAEEDLETYKEAHDKHLGDVRNYGILTPNQSSESMKYERASMILKAMKEADRANKLGISSDGSIDKSLKSAENLDKAIRKKKNKDLKKEKAKNE